MRLQVYFKIYFFPPQSEERDVEKAVEHAINIGYRHIDTAFLYGNESEIGEAIRKKIKDGTVKREELFITTKVLLEIDLPFSHRLASGCLLTRGLKYHKPSNCRSMT